MMTRYGWAEAFTAPAVFRFVDATKAGFVLEHEPYLFAACGIVESLLFLYFSLNFFEASIASGVAFFGCLLLGLIFRHPCRCRT